MNPSALKALSILSFQELRSDDLVTLFSLVQDMVRADDVESIDYILARINVSRTSTVGLVAMLRYASQRRHGLENWSYLLTSVQQELDRRGLDGAHTLRGLSLDKAHNVM